MNIISIHHKRLFFFQTSSTLWSTPTNKPQHILFKNQHNPHYCITYHSYYHRLLTQLFLHHPLHLLLQTTKTNTSFLVVVVVVDPTPPTCCQQSPAPEIMWQPAVSPPRWQGKAPLCRDLSRGPG